MHLFPNQFTYLAVILSFCLIVHLFSCMSRSLYLTRSGWIYPVQRLVFGVLMNYVLVGLEFFWFSQREKNYQKVRMDAKSFLYPIKHRMYLHLKKSFYFDAVKTNTEGRHLQGYQGCYQSFQRHSVFFCAYKHFRQMFSFSFILLITCHPKHGTRR